MSEKDRLDFIKEIHKDYKNLNKYLIDKYILDNNIALDDDFHKEEINDIYHFKVSDLLIELTDDFESGISGSPKHLTVDMIEEYIVEAVEYCIEIYQEMEANNLSLRPRDFVYVLK